MKGCLPGEPTKTLHETKLGVRQATLVHFECRGPILATQTLFLMAQKSCKVGSQSLKHV